MIKYAYQSGKPTYLLNYYIVDTEDEMKSLVTNCATGSKASVVESGNTYMLNGSKKWILQPTNSGSSSGGGGSSPPSNSESDIVVINNSPSASDEIVVL